MNRCKVCGEDTPNVFNIKLSATPICESCADSITYQQVVFLTSAKQGVKGLIAEDIENQVQKQNTMTDSEWDKAMLLIKHPVKEDYESQRQMGPIPCTDCPDGFVWTTKGQTNQECPTCKGHGFLSLTTSNPTRQDADTVKTFNEKEEHENDLRQESIRDYESDQLAGNPPEQGE